ncbi:hypothetical protein G5I_11709 [Acromyrmex echinatior]|uniref:Transmembrane protein n=1 Tax=Acromyrmex echinatior TaxID=103372 RepID=F4X0B7_ACREC|nr:hypothetical protein G5I_11709 [Acromyrmex echinatior]
MGQERRKLRRTAVSRAVTKLRVPMSSAARRVRELTIAAGTALDAGRRGPHEQRENAQQYVPPTTSHTELNGRVEREMPFLPLSGFLSSSPFRPFLLSPYSSARTLATAADCRLPAPSIIIYLSFLSFATVLFATSSTTSAGSADLMIESATRCGQVDRKEPFKSQRRTRTNIASSVISKPSSPTHKPFLVACRFDKNVAVACASSERGRESERGSHIPRGPS